jgi:hypothetical protein
MTERELTRNAARPQAEPGPGRGEQSASTISRSGVKLR